MTLQNSINLIHREYPLNIGYQTKPKDLLSSALQLFMQSYSNKISHSNYFHFYNSADGNVYTVKADKRKLDNKVLDELITVKHLDNKIKRADMIKPTLTEATYLLACINDYLKTFFGVVDLSKLEYLGKIRRNLAIQYSELRI